MTTINNTKKKQTISFSPSVNIIRDADTTLNYIATPNARQAYNQLINDYHIGVRSFAIVGAYGIGKSAFLWAFEQTLNGKKQYFPVSKNGLSSLQKFDVVRIIGDFGSVRSAFAAKMGVNKDDYASNDVFSALENYHQSLIESEKGLVIVIDEFGKFLEYAASNNPEIELYFIQQLAEFVNDSSKNIFFITTLHQDFNGYSRALTSGQQKEWDKVKGRLKEITFNEPVEQLLFLASERLPELGISKKTATFSKLFKTIEASKAFPLRDYFSESVAEKLLPFDILSAAVLTLSLQKYGQNERSLFSFIESNDHFGVRDFSAEKAPYYNLACVYDYLMYSHYSFITTKYNPHYAHWAAIRVAVERIEGTFTEGVNSAIALVKTIGLLNIFASASARIDQDFLTNYAKQSLGVSSPEQTIKKLEGLRIIRFVKYSSKYILFEGTDLDIELAIDEAGNFVERVTNVVHHLNKHFEFPYLAAKAIFYENGTPRFFAFHLSEFPEKLSPSGEVDGFINLIFSEFVSERDLREVSDENKEAVLYGLYENTDDIRNLLFEIEKIEKVKQNNIDDKVAIRELDGILQHQIKLLNHFVWENIYAQKSSITWYFNGVRQDVTGQKSFNRLLSEICREVYPCTPAYRNEMVNKTRLSGALSVAKKNLLRNLTENWNKRDLGFEANKFPPEKTVYLSLLRETGIHREFLEGFTLSEPDDDTFSELWRASSDFLNSARSGKRDVRELSEILLARPFKLKKGFVDFWIPIFLFSRRDDFALFGRDGYIPKLTGDTLDLVSRAPGDYTIKSFDIEGVKLNIFNRYRVLLNQAEHENPKGTTFIETIRPFLTFYRDLPGYAKATNRISKSAIAIRQAIAFSKDPEETFFDHFPKALGFTIPQLQKSESELELFVHQLKEGIKEIRSAYDELLNDFESFIWEEATGDQEEFPAYKMNLQKRFNQIKRHLLSSYQRVFIQRINSELNDRNAWLNSIAQACIGKALDAIKDEDKDLLFEKFKDTIHELDNLCEISMSGFDENKEIAFKLEVTSFVKGLQSNLVRLPKTKSKDFVRLQSVMKSKLTNDRQLNIATLATLLEELLKDEK
ncbi:hypothetical protein [Dyadobacter sandarakinus]|uniref:ATP-binding protein n=1 Tax=Dyadobacter sandarakinus TaxID=2747268 RepID=A0ABX7I701_9BACT|nr:hypothetical protein [Dyadobacter sandarakinus]QRR01498.1 hypothetical protein HWI92_11570 [Dyadobacter sandarakinus]